MKIRLRMKMAERALCSAIFVCVTACLLTQASESLADRPSATEPALPSVATLSSVANALSETDARRLADALALADASVSSCSINPEGQLSCSNMVWRWPGLTMVAGRWSEDEPGSTGRSLVVASDEGWQLTAQRWSVEADHVVLRGAEYEPEGGATLTVENVEVRHSSTDSTPVIFLQTLRWSTRSEHSDTLHHPVASARSAIFKEERWRIRALHIEPMGPPLGDVDQESATPRSGFLPPSVAHSSGEVTEVQATALSPSMAWGSPLAAFVRGTFASTAPQRWYAVGLGLVGPGIDAPDGQAIDSGTGLVTGGLVWRPGDAPAATGMGDAGFGSPLNHVAVAMESPGYREAWTTQLIRRKAYFRDWSHSRVGAALHAGGHALRADGFASRSYDGLGRGRARGGSIGFGTDHAWNKRATAGLELQHLVVNHDLENHHLSGLRGDVSYLFGRRDRLFLDASAMSRFQARLVPTDVGFGAGTEGALFGAVEAGMSFTGLFEGARHVVRPSLFGVVEVIDFEKTSQDAIADGEQAAAASTIASDESPRWGTVGLKFDQRVSSGAWTADLPLEAFFVSHGVPDNLTEALGGSIRLDLTHRLPDGATARLSGHVVCERTCDGVAWGSGAGLDAGTWSASYDISQANLLSQRVLDLQTVSDSWSRIRAFETSVSGIRVAQAARIGWTKKRFHLDAVGTTDFDGWGAALEPRVDFDTLGWSVGVTGFYDGFDSQWGLLAGLTAK